MLEEEVAVGRADVDEVLLDGGGLDPAAAEGRPLEEPGEEGWEERAVGVDEAVGGGELGVGPLAGGVGLARGGGDGVPEVEGDSARVGVVESVPLLGGRWEQFCASAGARARKRGRSKRERASATAFSAEGSHASE